MIPVTELNLLMKQYMNETDGSFMSPTDFQTVLKQGIRAFRRQCQQLDDSLFTHEVQINPNGAIDYDLSDPALPVNIFGLVGKPTGTPNATAIIKMYTPPNATGLGYALLWTPTQSIQQLIQARTIWNSAITPYFATYYFQRPVLKFACQITIPINIIYQSDDLIKTINGVDYVDDLQQFGDLIALLACQPYMVRDGDWNSTTMQLLSQRKSELAMQLYGQQDKDFGGRVNNVY